MWSYAKQHNITSCKYCSLLSLELATWRSEKDNPAILQLTHVLCHIVGGLLFLRNGTPPCDYLTREESWVQKVVSLLDMCLPCQLFVDSKMADIAIRQVLWKHGVVMLIAEVLDWLKSWCINDGNGLLALSNPQFIPLGVWMAWGNWQNGRNCLVVVLKAHEKQWQ